ncbi:DUF4865 family protein [Massilia sp. TS11]|uniref:DUF4865 family protein n=1 Tax=Massilia sp. TS11 TaxID=2908003 RepID=UPI001EDA56D6|nr:DUF4865 family protein [Massilia sp. TS11]MCG2585605.1 DUF4865 family protein [Massilia sp. TS11]
MIAMHYGFTFPADYDMAIIARRIAEKGHFTDGFPGLVFKAYLSARHSDLPGPGNNRYAPFYVWESAAAMNAFLCGPGFAGLTQAFGRPIVELWSTWWARLGADAHQARYASIDLVPIPRHADLSALQAEECQRAADSMAQEGALAAVAGFDPTGWQVMRFRLWDEVPASVDPTTVYALGHLSRG